MDKPSLAELSALVDWEKVAADVMEKYNKQKAQGGATRKETNVKRLYRVFVIDRETDEILVDGQSDIARSEESARAHVLLALGRDPDELVVRASCLFNLPSKDDES